MSFPTFVMPHWSQGADDEALSHITQAVNSILNQTDQDWELIIIDDLSHPKVRSHLHEISKLSPKIHIILKNDHEGAGLTRNVGITWSIQRGAPFILFLDSDDVAHPQRLEVTRKIFKERSDVSVVYSTFEVIDENNQDVPKIKLTPMLVEHLDSHTEPPEGPNAWIRIATETGYTNLTSSTSVRAWLAHAHPFCPSKASEDAHCWLRYSAGGDSFAYTPDIPSRYRVPQNKPAGSSSRALIGKSLFYEILSKTFEDGFKQAVSLALEKKKISVDQVDTLTAEFYVRTAETMGKEGEILVAKENMRNAWRVSEEATRAALVRRGLLGKEWINV